MVLPGVELSCGLVADAESLKGFGQVSPSIVNPILQTPNPKQALRI